MFSNSKSSLKNLKKIFKNVSFRFFAYRSFIHLLSIFVFKEKTVHNLAEKHKIKYFKVSSKKELESVVTLSVLGFAFNFDLVISQLILDKFEKGIYNIHASKLPKDRGISPLLWAFARGDKLVWSTIYKMDRGIDTGEICKQIQINVDDRDTSFSLYKKVCVKSGALLSSLVEDILHSKIKLKPQSKMMKSSYCSWPNREFSKMMRNSKRKMICFRDLTKK
ncbi:formyltransferase family protein [Akkermansiaceae bacterium]|nr:formyltransferase family protein [Akkermansiaceae bacterium]